MLISYQYRLYPTRQQAQALGRIVEIHRQLYNAALQERLQAWQKCRVSVSYRMQANQIKAIRAFDPDVAWLNYSSIQQTLRRLNKAFDAFFQRVKAGEKKGFPKFKGRHFFRSVCYVYNDGLRLKDGRLYVQNVGNLRMFQHRPLPDGVTKMVVLKRDRLGHWFATFQIETPDVQTNPSQGSAVGIDMGLAHFAVLSTGEFIENPRWFRQAEEKLAALQKRRARCKRGSHKYRELSRQITKLHQDTANERHNFHHQLSNRLVKEFGFIAVEDLNIQGLARSHVSKSIGDAGWGQFLQMLAYKAKMVGVTLMRVNPNGTSQTCSECGQQVSKPLSERQHHCPHCGFSAHRDVNAALNIHRLGLSLAVKCPAMPCGPRSAEAVSF